MRPIRLFLVLSTVLLVGALPAMADDESGAPPSHPTGVQNAIDRIEQATQTHIDVLTDLLTKVPEQAQSGIQRAIEAAQKGHDRALAALNGHTGGQDSDLTQTRSAGAMTAGGEGGGKPFLTGLEKARDVVAAAFEKSVSTLEKVKGQAPEQAIPHLEAALARVQESRAVALQNLDRLLASAGPDRASAERPDRGGHPDRPDRPDRPERPEPPERPERPEAPDHPGPLHG
jgi:hypothetical protein